jgi:hypothetical protein
MAGDVSSILKSLVELCGYGTDITDPCSLFGLLSASHLTYLLAKSGLAATTCTSYDALKNTDILGQLIVKSDLSERLPNKSTFVEELFLESIQRLNKLQFPLDVRSYHCLPFFFEFAYVNAVLRNVLCLPFYTDCFCSRIYYIIGDNSNPILLSFKC